MKIFTKSVIALLLALATFFVKDASGQSIMKPTDTVYTYNKNAAAGSSTNPTPPATQNTIGKWIRTVRMSWDTKNWKCYIYNGVPFRLRFPTSYDPNANDGKRYPVMVFFHGLGEAGVPTDNEYQLYHGGSVFESKVATGVFDGFILCMQSTGSWGAQHDVYIKAILEYMVANNKLDPFRISVNGLSAGGYNSWNFMETFPQFCASALPMSGISIYDQQYVNSIKYTPIWYFQGGLDGSPAQNTADQTTAVLKNAGGNLRYTIYPDLGHGTWDRAWSESDFFPWIGRVYMANPWTLGGRTQFCPGDPINVTIGVAPGLMAYQWRKDGVIIPGATSNSINATSVGTYDCRLQYNATIWSDWSRVPVVISLKQPTITPDITVAGLQSKVIPSLSSPSVTLQEPAGYTSYSWKRSGDTTTLGNAKTFTVTSPGNYIAKVTEQFGCSTNGSNPFTVINANGPNKPDAATGLVAGTLTQTQILLNWSQNPAPTFNETNFEVYQATSAGGPYTLVDIKNADVTKDTVTGLNSGTKYYFVIRAVNNTGASAGTNEASASTVADVQAPTSPGNVTVSGTTRNSIRISWTASTDNVAVTSYEVYINGVKSYTIADPTQTNFTVYGLTQGQNYALSVKAKDQAGNTSPASNQVSAQPLLAGLPYGYYLIPTSSSLLPDFTTLTPTAVGQMPNIAITGYPATSYYAFLWEGYIIIPQTGNYSFRTTSDDGSKVWLGALNGIQSPYTYGGSPIINNDGGHGSQSVTTNMIALQAGVYPIAIAYMNLTGGTAMTFSWRTPFGGSSYTTVPNSAFSDAANNNGSAPSAPSNLIATAVSYNSINLTWADQSNNETGFELWRSTNATTGFSTVGTVGANATTYTDNTVSASTKYYYQVRSINTFGQSALTSSVVEAEWKFNNNYADSSGNGRTLTQGNNPTFDATAANKAEGGYSVKLNGTNQNITIPNTNSFLQEAYNQRTFSCWIKPTSTTGTTWRTIWEVGGSDDGVCLMLWNNRLVAGVASSSSKDSVSTPFTNITTMSHVAVVYNGDSLLLYVNGTLAASKTTLSFHTLTTTSNAARIGQVNSSLALNIASATFYAGWIDDFTIFNTALSTAAVNAVKNLTTTGAVSNATTPNLPGTPTAPTGLVGTATGATTIGLTWTNTAANADNVQVYRSTGNNQNYVLWTTLPATATSYADANLFSNAQYFYKINALNAGGTSGYSNEVNATTLDVAPIITDLSNTQVRYGTSTTLQLSATSVNSGLLTFSSPNLPLFATLSNTSNTSANLVLNPAITDQGTYNITVIVADAFGGKDTTHFSLVVNDQYAPTIDSTGDYTMSEGDSLSIPLAGHNVNPADVLTIAVSGAPTTFTVAQTGNGTANLVLKPNFAGSGTYTVKTTVNDANGLSAFRTFNLTVNDKDPNTRVYLHINAGDSTVPHWNNQSKNATTAGLLDEFGQNTGINSILGPSWWWNAVPYTNLGANTGNNSGVYPDGVLKDYYFFGIWGGPDTVESQLTGMDPASFYDITFFGSSSWDGVSDNGWTTYGIGSQNATLHVQKNSTQTVTLRNIKPGADGTVNWRMWKRDGNTPLGYFNALVITKQFDDGTAPAAPVSLFAQNAPTEGGVKLSWVDKAYNETGYTIIRSTSAAGTYGPVGTVAAKATGFIDTTVSGGVQYWYRVYATNGQGVSPYTDSVTIVTADRIPKVNPIPNVTLTSGQSTTVTVTTVDDPTDHITLTASNLPGFASFVDNGDGTGTITVAPGAGDNGVYTGASITATDNSDSSRSASFSVFVVEGNVSSTYLNFSDTSVAPKPWNNLMGIPFAGTTISNLVDDGGVNTGVSVQIQGGFDGVVGHGMRPRNGTNVYPEAVTSTGYFAYSTDQRGLLISGLNPSKKYNFVLFGSYFDQSNCTTKFGLNGQTQVLNASYNSSKTVQFNGITPAANGQVTITITKDNAAFISVISSLVIQAYNPAQVTPVMAPADLRVINNNKNSISLQWQDRADSETSYELWRATSSSGPYTLKATLPANTTAYKDSNLTQNAYYYYTVRAVKNGVNTSYSNSATGYTYAAVVEIAFNSATTTQGPFPWNNLARVPELGYEWDNFINDLGQTTNVGMIESGDGWAGIYNGGGVSTGNNSGVFPDAVMQNSYVLFPGQHGKVTLTGLNLSQSYDLGFFTSVTGTYDASSIFTVQGKTTILNATLNQTTVMTMFNVVPNADGTVDIDVDPYTSNAQFGMLNALLVKSHTLNATNAPTVPVSSVASQLVNSGTSNQLDNATAISNANQDGLTALTAYPNPFKDAFTLAVQTSDNDRVIVALTDLSGKVLYQKQFEGLVQGTNLLSIQPSTLSPGVYFVNVTYTKTGAHKTIKVMKN